MLIALSWSWVTDYLWVVVLLAVLAAYFVLFWRRSAQSVCPGPAGRDAGLAWFGAAVASQWVVVPVALFFAVLFGCNLVLWVDEKTTEKVKQDAEAVVGELKAR